MMKAAVEIEPRSVVIDGDKRQRIPYVVRWRCPCGESYAMDFTEQGTYHLNAESAFGGEPVKIYLWCPKCGHEEQPRLRLAIIAELVHAER